MSPASAAPSLVHDRLASLEDRWHGLADQDLIAAAWRDCGDRFAIVSSMGAESAVLLHLAAEVDRAIPVLFIDTGRLFSETLAYRDALRERLGLLDLRSIGPDEAESRRRDPDRTLYVTDNDACCSFRKVAPLQAALREIDVWATGRKRYQAETRSGLPLIERDGARLKINPLADWSPERLVAYAKQHRLPKHPLQARGYPSIGCAPCTAPVAEGEDHRAGRWAGQDKTECGIHLTEDGLWVRSGTG